MEIKVATVKARFCIMVVLYLAFVIQQTHHSMLLPRSNMLLQN